MAAFHVRRERRRFPVGARPTRQPLQPEATGAGMEATKCLKPSDTRMDELLSGRNRQQSVSGARQLRGSAAAPVVALQA